MADFLQTPVKWNQLSFLSFFLFLDNVITACVLTVNNTTPEMTANHQNISFTRAKLLYHGVLSVRKHLT